MSTVTVYRGGRKTLVDVPEPAKPTKPAKEKVDIATDQPEISS